MAAFSSGPRFTLILVLLTVFYIIGIFIFTQGFLLSRLVVPKFSTCRDEIHNMSSLFRHEGSRGECWMESRFKKAVIIVIDAIRYDFMLYNDSVTPEQAERYQNKLKIIHEVLKEKPGHGKLFKFVADPPTTTMQRIKGLTTGSLPTFIDAGSNFASSEITEDNIISQLKNAGKNLIFMGDDTWLSLFPNSFKRSYPFPSFNVKDLHTVDNGIIDHLIPELKTNDWDVIIAHFLGVDHCGHWYGPYHIAMEEKLLQMDQVLRSVINEVDSETLLLVFGDHGMTKTGDHGGDSSDEVEAGLFVYSSTKTFSNFEAENDLVVSQTDIVPTLSLLLGTPIPFPNLGIVITSLFDQENETKLQALQLNAAQVHRYLTEYSKISNEIPPKALKSIEKGVNLWRDIPANFNSSAEIYNNYLKEVRELCRSVWARFDLYRLTFGLSIIFLFCIASTLIFIEAKLFESRTYCHLFTGKKILISLLMLIGNGILFNYGYLSSTNAVILALFCFLVNFDKVFRELITFICYPFDFKKFTAIFLLSLYVLAFFSNSFVVHEDKVLLFLLQTLFFVNVFDILKHSDFVSRTPKSKRKRESGKKWSISFETVKKLLILLVVLVLTRIVVPLWTCREEQQCEVTNSRNELGNGYQFCLSVFLVAVIPALLLIRLKSTGNLSTNSCTVVALKYAQPLGIIFVCLHWLLRYVPAKMIQDTPAIGVFQQIVAPCALYSCCMVTLACLIYSPLTVYFGGTYDTKTNSTETVSYRQAHNTVVDIFKRVCSQMSEDGEQLPIIYGLSKVYSSAIFICVLCFSLPVAILLGQSHSVAVALMLGHVIAFLELCKVMVVGENEKEKSSGRFVYPVIVWFMMSSYYFFASGHQATISSIRVEAAFVGLSGDFDSIVLPGSLIMLNTFGCDLIFAVSLPLIVFWLTSSHYDKDEFGYAEDPERLRSDVFRVCALYQLCKAFKLFGVMLAAAVHRRHLMVWKIFAPRFIFEGVSFIISSVALVFAYCFLLRVNHALQNWLSRLKKEKL